MKQFKKSNDNRILLKPNDRVKEFTGFEIEAKMQMETPYSPLLLSKLKAIITENSNFLLMTGLDDLSLILDFDYYGYIENGKTNMAIALIHHNSSPGKYWFRKKGEPVLFDSQMKNRFFTLKRTETNLLVEKPLTVKRRSQILNEEEKNINQKIFLVGTISREKYYFFIENKDTLRSYSISLDQCFCQKSTMGQLEIEYKWIRGQDVLQKDKVSRRFIKADIENLSSLILKSKMGKYLVPTKLTKWEWLLKTRGLK